MPSLSVEVTPHPTEPSAQVTVHGELDLASVPQLRTCLADLAGNLETTAAAVEVTQYVYLTDISRYDRYAEAFLYDRYDNKKTRLRSTRGFDRFRIVTGEKSKPLDGQVVQIGARDVIFQADGRYYSLHVGQSLQDALNKPLSQDEAESLTRGSPGPSDGGG